MIRKSKKLSLSVIRIVLSTAVLWLVVDLFVTFNTLHRNESSALVQVTQAPYFPPDMWSIQRYAYSSPVIQNMGCVITVVLMEPKLDSAAFAFLESVAAFVHPQEQACILIQTSLCRFQTDSVVTEDMAYQLLIDSI